MSTSGTLRLDQVVKYLPHLPSPKQRQILKYGCTEGLFGGAAGGGKSDFLLMAALQGITVEGYSAILFRRTFQDLSLSGALMDRSHQWWSNTDAHWHGESKTWRFPTGARISFGYLEGPRDHQRYQSAEYQFIGFDEASQFERNQSLYLLSRLRAPIDFPAWLPLRIRQATNPGGIGHQWLQERYRIPSEGTTQILEQRKDGKVIRVFVPSLATDNPGLDVAAYTKNLLLLDPVTRAQLLEGKWIIDGSGLVYYCYQPPCNVNSLPEAIPTKEWNYVLGVDFAATIDKTAFAVCAYSRHEPEIYLCWTEEHQGMSPTDAAKRINELTEQFGQFESVVGDSGGLGAAYILELQKHWALPIVPAEKTHKLAFIQLFNGELANNRLKIVAPYCETWVKQAQLLLWHDSTHMKEKASQHNDSTDAGLYSWRECRHYAASERLNEYKVDDPYEQRLIDQAQARLWEREGPALDVW